MIFDIAPSDSKVMDKPQRETQNTERLSAAVLATACKSVQVNGAAVVVSAFCYKGVLCLAPPNYRSSPCLLRAIYFQQEMFN